MSELITALLGGGAGLVAGSVAGWLVSRRKTPPQQTLTPNVIIDHDTESRIEAAAQQWASDRGMPEVSGLIARKLRLGLRLQEGRRGRDS
jgi:hypothetical protein